MKLLDRMAQVARRRRLADATIEAYTSWVRSYLSHCADRHGSWVVPEHLHTVDVEAFLNHLVLEKRLSASSQNQALNALVFLYRHVLENVIPQDHPGEVCSSAQPAQETRADGAFRVGGHAPA